MITENANELGDHLQNKADQYVANLQKANRKNAELVLEKCKQFSQAGSYTSGQLTAMGSPYALAHPFPPYPPFIINPQNGSYANSWVIEETDGGFNITNTSPIHQYLAEGTTKMIARPVLEEALKRTEEDRNNNLLEARERAFNLQNN